MAPRTNRELLTRGDEAYARKKAQKKKAPEEVTFDPKAREEYLTGFHKRNVQKKEKAIERAKELEREARLEERRNLRESRKEQFAKEQARMKEMLKTLSHDVGFDEEDEENEADREEDFSDWEGISDTSDKGETSSSSTGILKKRNQVYEDDEGGTTTVTIEGIDLETSNSITTVNSPVDMGRAKQVLSQSIKKAQLSAMLRDISENPPKRNEPKARKKVKYLSGTERIRKIHNDRARHREKVLRGRGRS